MLPGDDEVDASSLAASGTLLTLDGGPGSDVLIGGGDDDDIVIQLVGEDTVTSAKAADKEWLAKHARVVDGKTRVKVGGKERTLPRADLSELVRAASSV